MKKLLVGALAAATLASGAQAATVFGVDGSNNLVRFDSATPGTFTSTTAITGATGNFIALDFRDSNGLLYGLTDTRQLYTINTFNGAAIAIGDPLAITGANFGFDFNTAVDLLRIVSNNDNNYVVDPNTGVVTTTATDVAYGAGDVNAAINPIVTGNGYIHGTGTQYAIDTAADFLVLQANNAGTLTSVGALGFNVGQGASFDIGFDGIGYLQNGRNFYTVNLQTGAATRVGITPAANGSLFGIAVAAPVPEPGTWALLILGFGAVGGAMRRRTATAGAARMRLTYS